MNLRMLESTQNLWNNEYIWCTPPAQEIQNSKLNYPTKTQAINTL